MSKTFIPVGAMAVTPGVTVPAMAFDFGTGFGDDVPIGGGGVELGVGIGAQIGAGAGAGAGAGTGGKTAARVPAGGAPSAAAAADSIANADVSARVQAAINLMARIWNSAEPISAHTADTADYDISAWLDASAEARFDAASAASASTIATLRAAIAADANLSARLSAQNIDVTSVVALGATADGTLVAFTN